MPTFGRTRLCTVHRSLPRGEHDGSLVSVSVETVRDDSTTYEYEGWEVHPDEEVRIFVEAFSGPCG